MSVHTNFKYVNLIRFYTNPRKIALVIQTNKITADTLDITTFYNGTSLFDQIFIIQRDKNNNSTSIDYKNTICNDFSFPYCIFQNYDDLDHYAFMLSIYYEEDYVFYIDENEINTQIKDKMTSNWLDETIYSLENNQIDLFSCIISENNDNKLISGCLIIKQKWIRKLLTYTTINLKSSSVMNTIYSFLRNQKYNMNYNFFLKNNNNGNNYYTNSIYVFFCNTYKFQQNLSISVVTPVYKRDNIERMIQGLSIQNSLPEYLVILQSLHYIEIPSNIFKNSKFPIYYIWSPNWNMKYHARLYTSSIFDTKYVMAIDDDYFLAEHDIFKNVTNLLGNNNVIYGKLGELNFFSPNRTLLNRTKSKYKRYDHVGNVIFYSPKMSKIFLRYKLYTLSFGEDIGFCTTNNIECGTKSYITSVPTENTQNDTFRSNYSSNKIMKLKGYHNIKVPDMSVLEEQKSIYDVYEYYKSIGFIPMNYIRRNIKHKIIGDGKYH
ncbi:hypothetical protein WA158_005450 [Blastocystis sp. Blastoise]